MNKQTEALKMAKQHIIKRKGGRGGAVCYVKSDEEVIKAIDEALAQPAQEPVLYIDQGGLDGHATWAQPNACQNTDIPLYTHPAPSWQGLSDDEISKVISDEQIPVRTGKTANRFARAIEQALRERNSNDR